LKKKRKVFKFQENSSPRKTRENDYLEESNAFWRSKVNNEHCAGEEQNTQRKRQLRKQSVKKDRR